MNKYLSTHHYDTEHQMHVWTVVGEKGALHLWAEKSASCYAFNRCGWFGGLEIHRTEPSEYQKNDPPHHEDCWLLCGPCWHDGSSLVFDEVWLPFWQARPDDHERVLAHLRREADEAFEKGDSKP